MGKRVAVFVAVVGSLGLVSAILAFAGEGEKIKAGEVTQVTNGDCIYPSSPALGLGLVSVLLLIVAQTIINVFTGCVCCKKHPQASSADRSIALVCFIFGWVAFVIGFLLLLSAAALNNQRRQPLQYVDYCYVLRAGIFSGGGICSLATANLGIICYVKLHSSKIPIGLPPQNQGIAMGRPQVPPQATRPVFVHEDTYNRQQYP